VNAIVYGLLWLLFNAAARLCFRYQVIGREHIPEHGGVLVAANHASFLDIPLLGCGITRRVAFLGRQDLFPVPGLRWACQRLGWIPIRPDRLDRVGFGKATSLIKEGKVVVIYPEGSRTSDGALHPGKPGIGVIVEDTRCPVVPAYIAGTHEAMPPGSFRIRFRPIRVTFGKPLDFSLDQKRYSGKEFYRHVSRTVMERIAELGQVAPPADHSVQRPAARPYNAE
jgi:1-acyl-sn-glycerol-3-phosphate acyltransferase